MLDYNWRQPISAIVENSEKYIVARCVLSKLKYALSI